LSPYDLKRLESYANNMLDHHVVLDLLPQLSAWYFTGRFGEAVQLSGVQSALLLALGLQKKSAENIAAELNLPVSQVLALLVKIYRKMSSHFRNLQTSSIEEASSLPPAARPNKRAAANSDEDEETASAEGNPEGESRLARRDVDDEAAWDPVNVPLDQELQDAGRAKLREMQKGLLESELGQYAIRDAAGEEWAEAERKIARGKGSSLVSVKGATNKKLKSGEVVESLRREGEKLVPKKKKKKH